MLRLARPRDRVSRLDESEVPSWIAIRNPKALVGHLFAGPMAAVRGPAVVFIEPLGNARQDKCQGVASRIPHVGVEKTNVSISVHVVIVCWPEGWVGDQDLRHLARIVGKVDGYEISLGGRRLHDGFDVNSAVVGRVGFDKRKLQGCSCYFSPDALNIHCHTFISLCFRVLSAEVLSHCLRFAAAWLLGRSPAFGTDFAVWKNLDF